MFWFTINVSDGRNNESSYVLIAVSVMCLDYKLKYQVSEYCDSLFIVRSSV